MWYDTGMNSANDTRSIRNSARKTVRDVCAIKSGERVLIVTNRSLKNGAAQTYEISQAIYDECREAGAQPVLIVQPEKASLDSADPVVLAALKTEPDVFFSVSENKLGKDPEGIANPYIAEDGSKHDHIFDYLLYGKKSMRAVWTPGITLDMFARTVDIDYTELDGRCRDLCARYEGVVSVHVTAPGGTDITVPVAGRKALTDDGSFRTAGSGGNVPAGEVFISPVVGKGSDRTGGENPADAGAPGGCSGRIVFDGSMSLNEGDIVIKTPITVEVRGGFAVSVSGGEEAAKLNATIAAAERSALDMEKVGILSAEQAAVYKRNARNIGELGIGLNPAARITGNMLEDEKAFGTCHFAIGSNYDGDAPSLIHLDGVVRDPVVTFRYADGGTYTVDVWR